MRPAGVRVIDRPGGPSTRWRTGSSGALRPASRRHDVRRREARLSLLHGNWTYFPSICWRREHIAGFGFRQDLPVALDLALLFDVLLDDGGWHDPEVVFGYAVTLERVVESGAGQRAASSRRRRFVESCATVARPEAGSRAHARLGCAHLTAARRHPHPLHARSAVGPAGRADAAWGGAGMRAQVRAWWVTFAVAFVGVTLVQLAWALAVPPFRGSDEHDHAYRASEVADGEWRPDYVPPEHGRGDLITVRRDIVAAAHPVCTWLKYTAHDDCNGVRRIDDRHVLVASAAARYNPAFYWVIGSVAKPWTGAAALYAMRAAAAAMCAAAIAGCAGSWARACREPPGRPSHRSRC